MSDAMAIQVEKLIQNFVRAESIIMSNVEQGLIEAAIIVETDAKRRLTKGGQVVTGLLRATVTHRLIRTANEPKAQVGALPRYAKDVEFGSSPHRVPIADLLKWAKRKGLGESAAYAIQKSIEEKGTRPHPFLVPALLGNKMRIIDTIKIRAQKGIKESGK